MPESGCCEERQRYPYRHEEARNNRVGTDNEEFVSDQTLQGRGQQDHVVRVGRIVDAINPQRVRRASVGKGYEDNHEAQRRRPSAPTMNRVERVCGKPSQEHG